MPIIEASEVFYRLIEEGFNSSHFVWMLMEGLKYFQSLQGWVFAYTVVDDVCLLALDPLVSFVHGDSGLSQAWCELQSQLPNVSLFLFVGVYQNTCLKLQDLGFESVKIGEEPWVGLEHIPPRGNSAKGVRSAKNQAFRAGVQCAHWPGFPHLTERDEIAQLETVFEQWKKSRRVDIGGFLNTTDPFRRIEGRNLFVAKRDGEIQGFLTTLPVPKRHSAFFEDLVLSPNAAPGTGESLCLHAMEHFRNLGASEISLGVVSFVNVGDKTDNLSIINRGLLKLITCIALPILGNYGLDIFRRRFKPKRWEPIYIGLASNNGRPGPLSWLKAGRALQKIWCHPAKAT